MPIYTYQCSTCDFTEDVFQSIKSESLTTCSQCQGEGYARVLYPPTVFDTTPKTFGSIADRNTVINKTKNEESEAKANLAKGLPANFQPYRPDRKLVETLKDPVKAERWIATGRTEEGLIPSITTKPKTGDVSE